MTALRLVPPETSLAGIRCKMDGSVCTLAANDFEFAKRLVAYAAGFFCKWKR